MGKPKFDPPTATYPYKILRRYNMLSTPRKYIVDTGEGMPTLTPRGIRKSALNAHISDRVNDAAWPYIRRLLLTKRMCKSRFSAERLERLDRMIEAANGTMYSKLTNCVLDLKKQINRLLLTKRMCKSRFSAERLERLDRMIEAANGTMYSKLANCVLDLKKQDNKDVKKKKGWTESEWKKHMDYISQIAGPKRDFRPPPLTRGQRKPLETLLPRLVEISVRPQFKVYRRLSQESNYRDPVKVPPNALKYVITDRVKKLATPRVIPAGD